MQKILFLKENEGRLYLFITLVSMLILISDMRKADASILLAVLSLLMLSRPLTIVPMLFVTSWNMTFSIFGLGAYFYYFILFIIAMIFNHQQYGKFVGINRTTLLYILFAAYIVYSAVFSFSHVTGPAIRLMFTILSVAFAGLYQCRNHTYILKSLFWIAIVASVFFGFRMLISPVPFVIESKGLTVISNYWPSIMRHMNPNSAAQIITILSIILFISAVRIKQFKVLTTLAIFLNLNTLLLLASRTSFYALCISFAFYLITASHMYKYQKFFSILLTVGCMYFLNQYIESSASRLFVTSVLEDNGSGRFIHWAQLWKDVVPTYWLQGFGYGIDNYRFLGYHFDADNLYIDLLCQLGVIGSALFYFLHFYMMKYTNFARRDNIGMEMQFFMSVCFLVLGFGESVFDRPLYWAVLLLFGSLQPNRDSNANTFCQLRK
jgi:hypothetical protein